MSGISILMLVLLVHVGGVELDSARDAAIDLFAAGTPAGRWELSDRDEGRYQFVGADDLVRIERLSHPDLTYAIVHGRDATDMLGVGAVSLLAYREALRVGVPRDSLSLAAADALVAWRTAGEGTDRTAAMHEEDGAMHGDTSSPGAADDSEEPEFSAVDMAGSLVMNAAPGQMSISHPESGYVMVLRFSR